MRRLRTRSARALAGCALTAVLLSGCAAGGSGDHAPSSSGESLGFDDAALSRVGFADPQQLTQPSHGITVTGARGLSERAAELAVSTDQVSAEAPGGRNSVVVITPKDYDPAKKYPVVYLLPGSGATESPALQWYEAGQAEQLTQGLPVITVIVSGGKVGWYSDWASQEELTQNWETFHLDQVVPWVDQHLSTRADREHRVIIGNSMGGYGAMRYAEQRPDLFGEAVSLSGLLDLSSNEAKQTIATGSQEATGRTDSVFGNGSVTTEEQWRANDPAVRSGELKSVHVQLFAGRGNGQEGDIEPALKDTTVTMARELESQGVDYQYTEYGQAGQCNGGHEFPCWTPAATVALGRWADRVGVKRTSPQPSVPSAFEDVTSRSSS